MGNILAAFGLSSSGFSICNQNKMRISNVFCCMRRNVSEIPKNNMELENSDSVAELEKRKKEGKNTNSESNSDEFKDELIVGANNTFLSKHRITKQFYINKNIGHFTADTNGVPTYASDNVVKFIGMPRDQILQSISWVKNITNNYYKYTSWAKAVKDRKACVKKALFKFDNKHHYIIVEFHPIFDDTNYVGVHGIFLNVPKHIWQVFNEEDFPNHN